MVSVGDSGAAASLWALAWEGALSSAGKSLSCSSGAAAMVCVVSCEGSPSSMILRKGDECVCVCVGNYFVVESGEMAKILVKREFMRFSS